MLATLTKLGVRGAAGFLLGVLAVWWVAPTTTEGTALIIGIFVAVGIIVGGGISYFQGKKKTNE